MLDAEAYGVKTNIKDMALGDGQHASDAVSDTS
jgi:hypothetical protein